MANDIDMFKDITEMGEKGESQELWDLMDCFDARYNEGNIEQAEKLKESFNKKYGHWGNYY